MAAGKGGQESTARTARAKGPVVRRNTSQQELSNVDPHSNSFNESSLAVEKFRRSDADFEKTEQNINSL